MSWPQQGHVSQNSEKLLLHPSCANLASTWRINEYESSPFARVLNPFFFLRGSTLFTKNFLGFPRTLQYLLILDYFLERGARREKKREKNRCKRETSIGCLWSVPQLGSNPEPRRVPRPGIRPTTFGFAGDAQATGPHWSGLGFWFFLVSYQNGFHMPILPYLLFYPLESLVPSMY